MNRSWHYDLTEDRRHSGDAESLLASLCDDCAAELEAKDEIQFAGSDEMDDAPCWRCGA